jgi:hypothetical protein
MRKQWITIALILTVFIIYALFAVLRNKDGPTRQRPVDSAQNPRQASTPYTKQISARYAQLNVRSLSKEQIQEEVTRRNAEDHQWEWKIPIRFYGKVVDENSQPVPDARVHFQWTDISQRGTSQREVASNAQGLFALNDTRGKRLQVRVSKNGYYASAEDPISYEFANPYEEIFYTPNPDAPVIFHLRRKGGSEGVIVRSISPSIPLGEHGSTRVDLRSGRESPSGQLVLEVSKPLPAQTRFPYDWHIAVSIPNGGLIEHGDEFPFEAPETGYKSTVEYSLHAESGTKGVSFEKKFYFIIGEPKNYGRLEIRTDGISQHVFIDYALNPSGSRNLEPSDKRTSAVD